MSHTDYISQIAPGFEISAHTADCPVATAENAEKRLYAIQYHPEVLIQWKERRCFRILCVAFVDVQVTEDGCICRKYIDILKAYTQMNGTYLKGI